MRFLLRIVLLTLLIQLTSCDKEGVLTKVNGDVTDYYSDKPVSNYLLGLSKVKIDIFWPVEQLIDTFVTDNLGHFSYSFENDYGYYYKLVPISNSSYAGFEEKLLQTDKNNTVDIEVKPLNYLRIDLCKNTATYENIRITDNSQIYPLYDSTFVDDLILFSRSVPEEYAHLSIRLYNEKSWEDYYYFDTTIYVPRVDTFSIKLKY